MADKLHELPEDFLELTFVESQENGFNEYELYNTPFAETEVFSDSFILNARRLTEGEDVKEVYIIDLPSHGRLYEPGDTIGILPHNTYGDLSHLFNQLKISHLVHKNCKIIHKNEQTKLKSKPVFVDKITTLYKIFRDCIDIRCLPKKSLIKLMARYTEDENERLILEELCNKEGAKKYEDEILESNKTFLDLLKEYPSCCPPVARLVENLPPLLPRPYSIASSPLSSPDKLSIIFTVVKLKSNGCLREGLCTGMLKSKIENNGFINVQNCPVKMYYRKQNDFVLPKEDKFPIILIGPGSGVAPFMGFLEHMKIEGRRTPVWLFYGCRYKLKDYLFKEELEEYKQCGLLTKLIVSFSREIGEDVKYVQDNLRKYGKEVCDMVCEEKAIIYVCGDAKGLRKDVMNAFIDVFQEYKGMSAAKAKSFMKLLQKEKRYRQDTWL